MKTRAFTLIELLVVMAIIALLSAIIFPVFARVKLNAFKASDISAMNSIRASLELYHDDQGGFPPALLGYISPYDYQNGVTVVPANLVRGALYPKRIDSLETMKGSMNKAKYDLMTPGIWPQGDPRGVGTAPILDLNGDGALTVADDLGSARQVFQSNYTGTVQYFYNNPTLTPNYGASASTTDTVVGRFYAVSGYDVSPVKFSNGQTFNEVHYSLYWTDYAINNNGSANDDPRQLGYSDPPDTTVVTWNTFYRDYNSNLLNSGGSKDIVLFRGGSARPLDSKQMSERAWRMMP